jgi:UTP--glucose-1-phosphate uridylyltransferase
MQLSQAILPVAGLGTRFLPWTKVVPKELLPIGNQPIIALLVDECLSVGIKDICFVISRGKEAIPQYFYAMPELEKELQSRGKLHMLEELSRYDDVRFHVVYQEEMKGDGHALLQARDWIQSETVAVLFGDDLIVGERNGLQQLRDAILHVDPAHPSAMLCLQEVEEELVHRYGIVETDHHWAPKNPHDNLRKIKGLVEKPKPADAPSNLAIVGKYLIPKTVFERLHTIEEGAKDGEIRLIDALIAEKGNVDIFGYVLEGTRLDTGTPEGYKEAVKILG